MPDDSSHPEKQPVPGPQFLEASPSDGDPITIGFGDRRMDPRATDGPSRCAARTGLLAFIVAAAFLVVLIIGAVGGQIGVDHWLGVGAQSRSFESTLVDGIRFPASMLRSVYDTGVNQPLFIGLAMLVLIPAVAGLAAARPIRGGETGKSTSVRIVGLLTVGIVIVVDVIIAVLLLAMVRPDFGQCLEAEAWLQTLKAVAASDGVAATLAVLLAVLAFRLPVDRWARALGGTIAISTALAALCVSSASTSIVEGATRDRPVVRSAATGATSLLIGRLSGGGMLHLDLEPPHALRISNDRDDVLEVVGRESIVDVCSDRN